MMKQIGFLLLLLCISAQLTQAQMTFGGGAHVGIAAWGYDYQFTFDPQQQNLSLFGTGVIFGAHADMNVNKYFTTRLEIDYSKFSSDKEVLKDVVFRGLVAANPGQNVNRTLIDVEGNDASVFAVTVNAIGKYPFGSFAPYVMVGLGMHSSSFNDVRVTYSNTFFPNTTNAIKANGKSSFCFNSGLGLEYRFSFMKLFLEMYYAFASESKYLPILVGVSFP